MRKLKNRIKLDLLKIYQKHNPSISTNLNKNIKIFSELMGQKLHFPLRFFKGLKVGDIACGTGDLAFIAAKNGAFVDGYDFNKFSIEYANKTSKIMKLNNAKFYNKEFFEVKKKYDFIICTAALHHLPDPIKGLKHLKKLVKPKGFLLLSFGVNSSNLQHNLMKLIVRSWGKTEEKIKFAANHLFKNHIDRCVKFGFRSKASVINDQFLNKQHDYLNLKQVFSSLEKEFTLYSLWPTFFLPRADSGNNDTLKNLKNYLFFSEFLWSSKTIHDHIRIKKNIPKNGKKNFYKLVNFFNNKRNQDLIEVLAKLKIDNLENNFIKDTDLSFGLNRHKDNFFKELTKIFFYFKKKPSINNARKFLNKNKYVFKGTNGLGINYFLFQKR